MNPGFLLCTGALLSKHLGGPSPILSALAHRVGCKPPLCPVPFCDTAADYTLGEGKSMGVLPVAPRRWLDGGEGLQAREVLLPLRARWPWSSCQGAWLAGTLAVNGPQQPGKQGGQSPGEGS